MWPEDGAMANGGEIMIYQLSDFQTERFQKNGSSLCLSLGEKLYALGGGAVTDFNWEEPRNRERLLKDVKELEERIRAFKYTGASIITHPLIYRATAKPESNWIVLRVVSSLAYLNLFRGISPDVIGLAKTINPETNAIETILETRRVIALLILQQVILIERTEVVSYFLPSLRLASKLMSVILGGEACLAVLDPAVLEHTRRLQTERMLDKAAGVKRTARALPPPPPKPLTCTELFNLLSREIHGQEQAIRVLSVRGLLHLKRAQALQQGSSIGRNECIYFAGPSGCGKTFSAQVFSRITGLPHAIFDCSTVTQTGYVGCSVTDGCRALIRAAGGDPRNQETVGKARYGILVYDEVSKKRARQGSGLDISSSSVMAEFLTLMEGNLVTLDAHYMDRQATGGVQFNSNGTMFVFCGLLPDFDKVVAGIKRRKSSGLGFHPEQCEVKKGSDIYEAFSEYFPSEYVNRLSAIVPFQPLTVPALSKIVCRVIQEYNQLFINDGLKICLSDHAITEIAQYCSGDLQARGAKLVISALMEPVIFEGMTGNIEIRDSTVMDALERVGSVEGFV